MTADPGQTPAGTAVGTADLTLDAAAATADVPAELLAQSLGQYFRASWQRVRGGNAGILPVLLAITLLMALAVTLSGAAPGDADRLAEWKAV